MKGDFTRSTFNKKNHYSSVCMQQGRVQMDADWNEQMDIQAHLRQTKARDVIGLTGVPKYGGGFAISIDNNELKISSGRIYVGGILCELEEEITYQTQPDYPKLPIESDLLVNIADGKYLVYLDVWQRHISALEDKNIREKALGGPDTATRSKTVWQVKLQSVEASECSLIDPGWQQGATYSTGLLSARAKPGDESDNPCVLPPNAGYRRLENQLYRVEIHESGTEGSDNPTFKWSRDNGSIVAKVEEISGEEITVSHAVQGRLDEFSPGRWIELTDDGHELRGKKGVFLKIKEKNGEKIKVEPSLEDVGWNPDDFSGLIKIRRWDSNGAVKVEIPAGNEGFLKLEDGVEIKFEQGKEYKTGDYWLIPARRATADIEWPKDGANNPKSKTPDGIKHHYGQLALVEINDEVFVSFIQDCRESFPPLNEIQIGQGCCTVTVGDGKSSFGDVDSIQEAIGKVRTGGDICLLPGVHEANVIIEQGKNISIKGCGKHTLVIPEEKNADNSIFHIKNSEFITIENINMVTLRGTAIVLEGTQLKKIEINYNRILSYNRAIWIEDGADIRIIDNEIGILDRDEGEIAISMMAEDSIIGQNDIRVIHATDDMSPIYFFDGSAIPYPNNPQLNLEGIYDHLSFNDYVNWLWNIRLNQRGSEDFKSLGGIRIDGGSDNIRIDGNLIIGGAGNGIFFGKEENDGFLYDITVERNIIRNMGLAGIGVFTINETLNIEDLTICLNDLERCLMQIPEDITDEMVYGAITLASCENVIIRENRIVNNGVSYFQPVCGIYISYGEKIDISENRVLNNGPFVPNPNNEEPKKGIRGGIVIKMCAAFRYAHLWGKDEESYFSGEFGIPALKVHNNIVTQPLAWALAVVAIGPVSVVSNQFITQDINLKANPLSIFGAAVFILDLGVSQNIIAQWFTPKDYSANDEHNPTTGAYVSGTNLIASPQYLILLNTIFGYLFSGGNVMFCNNQTTLELKGKELASTGSEFKLDVDWAFSSQFIFSLDDVSFIGNQSDCNFLIDLLLTNTAIFGVSVRTSDNRFKEGLFFAFLSLFSKAMVNTVTNNQATHCIYASCSGSWGKCSGNIVLFEKQCSWFVKALENMFGPALINGE